MTTPLLTAGTNYVYHCKAEQLLRWLPDASIDLIVTDTPYNSTELEWDSRQDWSMWWNGVRRVLKHNGACLMFANMLLAAQLIASNPREYKYEWVWEKDAAMGKLNSHYRPMKQHEFVLVFSRADATPNQFRTDKIQYNPQGIKVFNKSAKGKRRVSSNNTARGLKDYVQEYTNYPTSVLHYGIARPRLHPTQKPLKLVEYLIKTYSTEGQLVVDPFCGSGTTLVAAHMHGRRYLGCDLEAKYVDITQKRLAKPFDIPLFTEATA